MQAGCDISILIPPNYKDLYQKEPRKAEWSIKLGRNSCLRQK